MFPNIDREALKIFLMILISILFAIFIIVYCCVHGLKETSAEAGTMPCVEDLTLAGDWHMSIGGMRAKTKCGWVYKGNRGQSFFTYVEER